MNNSSEHRGIIFRKTRNLLWIKKFHQKLLLPAKLSGKLQQSETKFLVGDQVKFKFTPGHDEAIIFAQLPRINYLKRPSIANVEFAVILIAVNHPKPDWVLLNQLLTWIASQRKITPILIITKTDLNPEQNNFQAMIKLYQKEYQVAFWSKDHSENLAQIRQLFQGVSVLLGKSGVGKSTLLNHLDSNLKLSVGKISRVTKSGKHHTTMTQYYEINQQLIADTPGFNWINLQELSSQTLLQSFPFWHHYANQCFFKSCTHLHEQKCAVKAAIIDDSELKVIYETWKVIWSYHQKFQR